MYGFSDPYEYKSPSINQIEQQSNFFHKKLNLPKTHSQEITAFYYDYPSWCELKNDINNSTPKEYAHDKLCGGNGHYAPEQRQFISDTLKTSKGIEFIKKLSKMPLIPYTLSNSLAQSRVDWLMDDEVKVFYDYIIRDEYFRNGELLHALHSCDNSFLTKIYHMEQNKKFQSNTCLWDFRFGVKSYYYIFIDESYIEILIREFDTHTAPPHTNENPPSKYIFNYPWFQPYIIHYVNYITKYLSTAGYHGKIIINTIDNLCCNSPTISKHITNDTSGMIKLINRINPNKTKEYSTRLMGKGSAYGLEFII